MSLTDSGYLDEIEREKSLRMATCRCSNCDPHGAARIIRLLPHTKLQDLDELISSRSDGSEDVSLLHIPKSGTKRKMTCLIPLVCKANDPIRMNVPMIDLAVSIMSHFEILFNQTYPVDAQMSQQTLFNREDAWKLVKNYELVSNGIFLREILGGQILPGMFNMIIQCIQSWYRSESYFQHQSELQDIQIANDQDILDTNLIEEEHQEEIRLRSLAKAAKAQEVANQKVQHIAKAMEVSRLKEKKRSDKQKKNVNLDMDRIKLYFKIRSHVNIHSYTIKMYLTSRLNDLKPLAYGLVGL